MTEELRRNLTVASWPRRTDDGSVAVEFLTDEQAASGRFEAAGPDPVCSVNDIAQFPLARVIAVLSSAPGRTGPVTDLQEDGPDDRH
jgi:hypothetical protein